MKSKKISSKDLYCVQRKLMWDYIRRKEAFTIQEVAQAVGRDKKYVAGFLGDLRRGGIIKEVSEQYPCFKVKVFTVCHYREATLPYFNKNGELVIEKRELMWRTMKMLFSFSPKDLAIAASTDTHLVAPTDAEDYIKNLYKVGYLHLVKKHTTTSQAMYKLKASMNSGPNPPKVKARGVVIDMNTCEIHYGDNNDSS